MESHKITLHETGIVAIGVGLCTAAMLGIFILTGNFRLNVLWGGLLGTGLCIGNFFFMAIGTGLAADKAQAQDVKAGQLLVRNSYILRLIALFVILYACAKSGLFNLTALVLPLFFVRPTITLTGFIRKKGDCRR